jgi:hypothetical protein
MFLEEGMVRFDVTSAYDAQADLIRYQTYTCADSRCPLMERVYHWRIPRTASRFRHRSQRNWPKCRFYGSLNLVYSSARPSQRVSRSEVSVSKQITLLHWLRNGNRANITEFVTLILAIKADALMEIAITI